MPELRNRNKLENELARELAKIGGAQSAALMRELGNPPSLSNVSDDFWAKYGAQLTALLNTFLEKVYLQQAQDFTDSVGVGVDWGLVNKDAAAWARQYSYELVKGITDTTKQALQDKVGAAIEQSWTLGQLRESIAPMFGPVRAEMIATTELTRASSQAEAQSVERLKESGVRMRGVWMTREDELVCLICGEEGLSGVKQDDNGMFKCRSNGELYDIPPAHPRCRCSVGYEIDNG